MVTATADVWHARKKSYIITAVGLHFMVLYTVKMNYDLY